MISHGKLLHLGDNTIVTPLILESIVGAKVNGVKSGKILSAWVEDEWIWVEIDYRE